MKQANLSEKEQLYTSREAAELLGVTPRTVQLWADNGVLSARRTHGGHRRFEASEIETVRQKFADQAPAVNAGKSSLSVLVAEDEPDLRKLYEMTLVSMDLPIVITTVSNGYEALLAIGRDKPDFLIVDLNMPRMDGFQMIRAIGNDEQLSDLDVIAVSALSREDIAAKGGVPENIRVFPKPIPFSQIEDLLKEKTRQLVAA